MISDCLSETLNEWNIKPEQVLIVITDNEANMVKALKCVNENLLEKLRGDQLQNSGVPSSKDEEDEEGGHVNETDDDTDTDSESENSRDEQTENKTEGTEAELTVTDASQVHMISIDDFQEALQYSRMPCQAHSLQLVIKEIDKNASSQKLLMKARKCCKSVRKSSVAVEKLIAKCKKTILIDCPTRWNDTLMMMHQMLENKIFTHRSSNG